MNNCDFQFVFCKRLPEKTVRMRLREENFGAVFAQGNMGFKPIDQPVYPY